MEEISQLAQRLRSAVDDSVILDAIGSLRKMLSREDNPPIDCVISAGLVPDFVRFLRHANSQVQYEAAWTLTNVASGTTANTAVVVGAETIPVLVHLLDAEDVDVREQAVWALSNIAGDSTVHRDAVLNANALPSIIAHVDVETRQSFLRKVAWTISNCLRGEVRGVWRSTETRSHALSFALH